MIEILCVFLEIVLLVSLGVYANRKKSVPIDDPCETAPENEKGEGGYILDLYGMPERVEGDGVLKALLSAFRDLERQRAAGFRNWISACIEQAQRGYDVPPEVALTALRLTRDEISGPRFVRDGFPTIYYDLSALNNAISAVEKEMGEGA